MASEAVRAKEALRRRGSLGGAALAEIQRSRMLAATVEVVGEVGYRQLTVAQITHRARVSRKTFYDAFGDREACFRAAFEQAADQTRALLRETDDPGAEWSERIRRGLARVLALMDDEPRLARLCVVEAAGAGEAVGASRARVLDELAGFVDRGRLASGGDRDPPAVTAEAVVGAVLAVLHERLQAGDREPLKELAGSLASIVILPYLGSRAACQELSRRAYAPRSSNRPSVAAGTRDPLRGLEMRLTYRTVRVLGAIAEQPGASNRQVAARAGVADPAQISKLMARLARLRLVENRGGRGDRGSANAWHLTRRGAELERACAPGLDVGARSVSTVA